MSRWLKSVNTLLDQLDGQVENVVDNDNDEEDDEDLSSEEEDDDLMTSNDSNRLDEDDDDDESLMGGSDANVEAILNKRGLGADDEEEEDDNDEDDDDKDEEEDVNNNEEERESSYSYEEEEEEETETEMEEEGETETENEDYDLPNEQQQQQQQQQQEEEEEEVLLRQNEKDASFSSAVEEEHGLFDVQEEQVLFEESAAAEEEPAQKEESQSQPDPNIEINTKLQSENEHLKSKLTQLQQQTEQTLSIQKSKLMSKLKKQQQKSANKLHKTVIKMNTELEASEREIEAQRVELERAAERMERDRVRNKTERERIDREHEDMISHVTSEHQNAILSMQTSHAIQMEEMLDKLKTADEARVQEGGDYSMELEEVIKREQTGIRKIMLLEDEKSTLSSQISTLQTQIQTLETRMENLSNQADTASERERDAEDRLDAALTLHARQLSTRQSRESELERNVADLGAALVVAKQRMQQSKNLVMTRTGEKSGEESDGRVALVAVKEELETVNAQLALERQHTATLNKELRDMSKQQSHEAVLTLTKQRQHDRQVADLSSINTRLQQQLVEQQQQTKSNESQPRKGNDVVEQALKSQINSISSQLLQKQKLLNQQTSDVSTLKSRLSSALTRAEIAEKALVDAQELETANMSTNKAVRGMRRRATINPKKSSVRRAMYVRSDSEYIGNIIDSLDTWSMQIGHFLRKNPLARGLFILYWFCLHFWVFCVFVFHVYALETAHGDFGFEHSGGRLNIGGGNLRGAVENVPP
eukprot:CAMPEP_0195514058 /NCGR_PEP_ID=MMETSP0794_2-20130614/5568_1 /TAXON_ID=515487 /ORGANISM="Stephanopyxis turris, Strain CCMP 815" /LENGTH=763 /DNA_ID=CAMNT_0040642223 /DNA_START=140 /DNA_END=2431 /DNA_ORIENTATION=-